MKLSTHLLLALSCTSILLGISLIHFSSTLLHYIVKSQLVLSVESEAYQLWKHVPHRFPFDVYMFNWTNPHEIQNQSIKPNFEEVGPYRFATDLGKTNITWYDNDTVSYTPLKYFYPKGETERRMQEDRITNINPMALGAAYKARNWNYLVRKSLALTMQTLGTRFYLTHTVDEVLFKGYEDQLVKIGKTFVFYAGSNFPDLDKFGWYYKRNGTSYVEGFYSVGTGKGTTFAEVYEWNFKKKTPFYDGMCADLRASAGENFGPNNFNRYIKLFSAELCRSVILQYVEDTLVNDIPGRKYIIGDFMLDNGTKYPEHKCSCAGDCLPVGTFNTSSCFFGIPFFGSLPHFHRADPYYNSLINVSKAKARDYDFYVVVEPHTGLPLEMRLRLQINLQLTAMSIHFYENLPTVFIPVMWLDQEINLPDSKLLRVKWLLYVPKICVITGSLLIVLGIILILHRLIKGSKLKPVKEMRESNALLRPKS